MIKNFTRVIRSRFTASLNRFPVLSKKYREVLEAYNLRVQPYKRKGKSLCIRSFNE